MRDWPVLGVLAQEITAWRPQIRPTAGRL